MNQVLQEMDYHGLQNIRSNNNWFNLKTLYNTNIMDQNHIKKGFAVDLLIIDFTFIFLSFLSFKDLIGSKISSFNHYYINWLIYLNKIKCHFQNKFQILYSIFPNILENVRRLFK